MEGRLWSVVRPDIRDRKQVLQYVARITILCASLALAIDVAVHMLFFIDWSATLRSWTVSVSAAVAIATPVATVIARTHLDLYRAKREVEELSRTDPLTGLLNRRALFEPIEGPQPDIMALVIVDIDRFKRVNDTYGHLTGDKVIKMVAETIKEELGAYGSVGRIGGEEFALVAASVDTETLAKGLWRLRDRVASMPIVAASESFKVTVSIGFAVRDDGQSFDDLFHEADRALYLAKSSGRNRVVAATDAQAIEAPARSDQPNPQLRRKYRATG